MFHTRHHACPACAMQAQCKIASEGRKDTRSEDTGIKSRAFIASPMQSMSCILLPWGGVSEAYPCLAGCREARGPRRGYPCADSALAKHDEDIEGRS